MNRPSAVDRALGLAMLVAGLLLGTAVSGWSQDSAPSAWRSTSLSASHRTDSLLPPPPNESRSVALATSEIAAPPPLPNNEGQVWREYDISRYTMRHANEQKPEQSLVDWILRETGTEMWFSQPLGILNADRRTMRVYHTPEIQRIVSDIVDRFLRPETESYLFGVRMVTVSSPNWRTKELPRLKAVNVQTPGVEAWLLSHEDAAVVLADLRRRTDFREHNSPNLLIGNGDTHSIARMRPVSYIKSVTSIATAANGWGGQPLGMGQVEEGFTLQLSPLMAIDGRHLDAVIKIDSHQVERLESVSVATPTAQNPRQMSTIQVPQTSSWSLHERFHWPANRVLLISCGVVSSPGPEQPSKLNLPSLKLTAKPPRSDALLFVDAKGRASDLVPDAQRQAQAPDLNYRGRY